MNEPSIFQAKAARRICRRLAIEPWGEEVTDADRAAAAERAESSTWFAEQPESERPSILDAWARQAAVRRFLAENSSPAAVKDANNWAREHVEVARKGRRPKARKLTADQKAQYGSEYLRRLLKQQEAQEAPEGVRRTPPQAPEPEPEPEADPEPEVVETAAEPPKLNRASKAAHLSLVAEPEVPAEEPEPMIVTSSTDEDPELAEARARLIATGIDPEMVDQLLATVQF